VTIAGPVWSPADAAELDVLVWALISGYSEHREKCRACAEATYPCPHLAGAIDLVLNWRQARMLLSCAPALRIDQELAA
jgi:hypothetical protein